MTADAFTSTWERVSATPIAAGGIAATVNW